VIKEGLCPEGKEMFVSADKTVEKGKIPGHM
jgi:hypothetical protein